MLNNQQNSPGIRCPNPGCGNIISVSLQDLLFQKNIQCPHCLLILTMDREKSKDTIEAMATLNTAIQNAETAKKFDGRR
jgi:DNA-directed RNA polymerase subunit RPC12/RpoP